MRIVVLGYYKQEDETAQTIDKNGWLHTGDIGLIDDDDNVFIVDRIKELIKYKGFQVSYSCVICTIWTYASFLK